VNNPGKQCPVCGNENDNKAVVCSHCGAWLEDHPTRIVSIPENFGGQTIAPVQHVQPFIDIALIPEGGVGIYVAGEFKPYYVHIYKELILGRQTDATLESVLDLTDLNAANLGVSKRHAMIRRSGSGFEVLDLSSRNGTWLNAERLVPNRAYPFASGSQIRIGQMRLLVVYHSEPKDKQQS